MKKFKLIAAFAGLVLLASCTQKSCPTYSQIDVEQPAEELLNV